MRREPGQIRQAAFDIDEVDVLGAAAHCSSPVPRAFRPCRTSERIDTQCGNERVAVAPRPPLTAFLPSSCVLILQVLFGHAADDQLVLAAHTHILFDKYGGEKVRVPFSGSILFGKILRRRCGRSSACLSVHEHVSRDQPTVVADSVRPARRKRTCLQATTTRSGQRSFGRRLRRTHMTQQN
jgi:hypothetical protein